MHLTTLHRQHQSRLNAGLVLTLGLGSNEGMNARATIRNNTVVLCGGIFFLSGNFPRKGLCLLKYVGFTMRVQLYPLNSVICVLR